MIRVFTYARFSSDLQNDKSNADQHRENRAFAARQDGWTIAREFDDAAISGASLMRPDFQAMMRGALSRECDVVLAESLDRFSRDQEHVAWFYKQLAFVGVRIFTVNYGEITPMHVGLLGTMSALYLKDLADKTSRGLRGQVERGKSAGGLSYGYRYDRSRLVTSKRGEVVPEKGVLVIHPEEAGIVLRIQKLYVAGLSPEAIAKLLNAEGIPGPGSDSARGPTAWSPSTINGNSKRGTGILNNELYIGTRVWNRQRFLKNPETRRRVARLNPPSEWLVKDVPHLRIPGLTDDLWKAVKARQSATRQAMTHGKVHGRRPIFLFSKLTKCGACGAGFNLSSRDTLRCFNYEKRGTCANTRTITRLELEGRVLRAMHDRLFSDDSFAAFCEGFREEQNRLRMEQRQRTSATKSELDRVTREIRGVIDAIKAGVPGSELKSEMEGLQARKAALSTQMTSMDQPEPLLHPSMADVYRSKVEQLAAALQTDDAEQREAARSGLRALITKIVIPSGDGPLRVFGNLGEMLAAAANGRDGSVMAAVAQSGCGGGI